MLVRLFGAVIVAAIVALGFTAPAVAQAPQTAQVVSGQESTVARSAKELKITKAPVRGVARSIEVAEDNKFRILYKANETRESVTDELTYTIDGDATAKVLKLEVSPPAPGFTPQAYDTAAKAIFLLFVLAVILESALALLFNWRPFVETFNSRAVRPLVAFIVAMIFVATFDLDLVTGLVNASMAQNFPANIPGKILTAMVIAGGSAGVNNLLVGLGFRQVRTPETVLAVQKPNAGKAWVSVRLNRKDAVGPVDVCIDPPPPTGTTPTPTVAGTIRARSIRGWRYFLSDPGRFPGYGGWEIAPGTEIVIQLHGLDQQKKPIKSDAWGPYKLADRAVIDLELTL